MCFSSESLNSSVGADDSSPGSAYSGHLMEGESVQWRNKILSGEATESSFKSTTTTTT